MERYFSSIAAWKELLSSDFNSGYIAGVGLVLAIVLLFLVVRIVFGILFRNRRAKCVVIPAPDGDVQISEDAVTASIHALLKEFPEFSLDALKIYRRGKRRYWLWMQCSFTAGEKAFPEVASKIKEAVFAGLERDFGMTDLRRIRILLKSLTFVPGAMSRPQAVQESVPESEQAGQ